MATVVSVERLRDLPPGFAALRADSERTGVRFLARLAEEWTSGANRFDRPGECLLGIGLAGALVAIGGLNVDPYAGDPRIGRVRHLYVHTAHRRHGLGRRLLDELVAAARGRFDGLRLRTVDPDAARLYERLGFRSCSDPHVTHVLTLAAPPDPGGARCSSSTTCGSS